jgi:hypothetical protein
MTKKGQDAAGYETFPPFLGWKLALISKNIKNTCLKKLL